MSLFLEDWELLRVALICHKALDLLCQEMKEACQESPLSQCTEVSLSPWKSCDSERIVSGRLKFRKKVRKKVV